MSFEVEGTLHKKFDVEQKSGSFQTRDFVLQIDSGNYPQVIKFQLLQERCSVIDPFAEGDKIKVHFDLRGREWQGKYLTNLNAWRVEGAKATASAAPENKSFPSADDEFPSEMQEPLGTFSDDLPF